MNKKALIVLSATPMLLASCNGLKKVEFTDFQKEVTEALKEETPTVKTMKVSGKFNDEKYSFKASENAAADLSMKEYAVLTAVSLVNVSEFALLPVDGATYYVQFGFKVKTDDFKFEFNKHGLPTLLKGEYKTQSMDLRISYTYEK